MEWCKGNGKYAKLMQRLNLKHTREQIILKTLREIKQAYIHIHINTYF